MISTRIHKKLVNFTFLVTSALMSLVVAEFAIRWALADKVVLFPRNFAAADCGG
jgi:hypothetical protein